MKHPVNSVKPQTDKAVGDTEPSPIRDGVETIQFGVGSSDSKNGGPRTGQDIVRTNGKPLAVTTGKVCRECSKAEPEVFFYKNRRVCKSCLNKRAYEYHMSPARIEKTRAANRLNWHKHGNNYRKLKNANRKTLEGRVKRVDEIKRFRSRRPEVVRAHNYTWYRRLKGEIVPPEACERCGCIGKLESHHPDYDNPHVIEWLCFDCHSKDTASGSGYGNSDSC